MEFIREKRQKKDPIQAGKEFLKKAAIFVGFAVAVNVLPYVIDVLPFGKKEAADPIL